MNNDSDLLNQYKLKENSLENKILNIDEISLQQMLKNSLTKTIKNYDNATNNDNICVLSNSIKTLSETLALLKVNGI